MIRLTTSPLGLIKRAPNSASKSSISITKQKDKDVNTIGKLQMGDVIGRVIRALDLSSGQMVAVKKLALIEDMRGLMNEIELLSALKHENIVQLFGHQVTETCLLIVMEYCENGSLADMIAKFGPLPENLTVVYIRQVLQGLSYLHAQGVIHRDIKGANVLTVKSGIAKLADFGVASNTLLDDEAIAGSTYWMAPEVIELRGATCASDIWSVGCTAVELFTGSPPYGSLAPMTALFRIVNDDHPELPALASIAFTSFLLNCFQKEPHLRITAPELLKSTWFDPVPYQRPVETLIVKQEVKHATINMDDYVDDDSDFADDFCEGNDLLSTGKLQTRIHQDMNDTLHHELSSIPERIHEVDVIALVTDWMQTSTFKEIESTVISELFQRRRYHLICQMILCPKFTPDLAICIVKEARSLLELSVSNYPHVNTILSVLFDWDQAHINMNVVNTLTFMLERYPYSTIQCAYRLTRRVLESPTESFKIPLLNKFEAILSRKSSNDRMEIINTLNQKGIVHSLIVHFRRSLGPDSHPEQLLALQCLGMLQKLCVCDDYVTFPVEIAVREIMTEMKHLRPSCLHAALKLLHRLCMSSENLEAMEINDGVSRICQLLSLKDKLSSNVSMMTLNILFSLLRLSKIRQRKAVEKRVIPTLLYFSKLPAQRQLAIPILCELVYNGSISRSLLLAENIPTLFLDLLGDICWRSTALESLAHWFSCSKEESKDLETFILATKSNALSKLLDAIGSVGDEELIMRSLLRVVMACTKIAGTLSEPIFGVVINMLSYSDSASVKTNCLRVLERVLQVSETFISPKLRQALKASSVADKSVLVRQLSSIVLSHLKS